MTNSIKGYIVGQILSINKYYQTGNYKKWPFLAKIHLKMKKFVVKNT
jgi:hypothetical protein